METIIETGIIDNIPSTQAFATISNCATPLCDLVFEQSIMDITKLVKTEA